jgi:hypothetical protein
VAVVAQVEAAEESSEKKKVKARRQTIDGVDCLITSANLVYLESTKELMGTWCEDSKSVIPMEESDSDDEEEEEDA